MQRFPRSAIHTHCVGAVWPEFLGEVKLGESFIIETERYNAVNGPIRIDGIRAGDALAIVIEGIEMVGPFEARQVGQEQEQPIPLDFQENCFYFPRHFRLKANPTVGNIGMLPKPTEEVLAYARRAQKEGPGWGWRQVMNAPRGRHCHQDCPWLTVGSVLHLEAQVDGAGLCVADVHGYQPQGTMAYASIEVAANVQLRVERSQGWLTNWPVIETQDEVMVLVSHSSILEPGPRPSSDTVAREAYEALRDIVAARVGCSPREAANIVATAMDLRQCATYGLEEGYDLQAEGGWEIALVAALPKDSFL